MSTANNPKVRADTWICHHPQPATMASAAPNPAPADTPRMSGETIGFLNRV